MSSVTLAHRSDNEELPRLVGSVPDTGIRNLVFLPDGRRVVTASKDGTVKDWNLETGEQEGRSMKHRSEIFGLAVTKESGWRKDPLVAGKGASKGGTLNRTNVS